MIIKSVEFEKGDKVMIKGMEGTKHERYQKFFWTVVEREYKDTYVISLKTIDDGLIIKRIDVKDMQLFISFNYGYYDRLHILKNINGGFICK